MSDNNDMTKENLQRAREIESSINHLRYWEKLWTEVKTVGSNTRFPSQLKSCIGIGDCLLEKINPSTLSDFQNQIVAQLGKIADELQEEFDRL